MLHTIHCINNKIKETQEEDVSNNLNQTMHHNTPKNHGRTKHKLKSYHGVKRFTLLYSRGKADWWSAAGWLHNHRLSGNV